MLGPGRGSGSQQGSTEREARYSGEEDSVA